MVNHKNTKLDACLWFWAGMILMQVGCSSPLGPNIKLEDLQSPDPTVRVMAIKWAGENKVSQAVPQLVDFLQHDDRSVRFYAIQGLQRITGTDNGYDYKANPKSRAAAVQRWREFINSNKSSNYEN